MTRSMPRVVRARLALISMLVLLAACASSKPKPQPLEPLTPKIAGREVWNRSVNGIKFPLTVSVPAGATYAPVSVTTPGAAPTSDSVARATAGTRRLISSPRPGRRPER